MEEQVPEELLTQLKVGGVMVLPVGDGNSQVLMRVRRTGDEEFERETLENVRFVPMLAGTVR